MRLDVPYRRKTIRLTNLRGDKVRVFKGEDGKVRVMQTGNIPATPDPVFAMDPSADSNNGIVVYFGGSRDRIRSAVEDAVRTSTQKNRWMRQ